MLETGLRHPISFLKWSDTTLQLCIGTHKGDVLLYLHNAARKVPIMGLHHKSIVTGAWSAESQFGLGEPAWVLLLPTKNTCFSSL